MWRAALIGLGLASMAQAALATKTADSVVQACGGLSLVLEPGDGASDQDVTRMATVLERRLDFFPDPFTNSVAAAGQIVIDLPLALGMPEDLEAFLQRGVLEAHWVEHVPQGGVIPNGASSWPIPDREGDRYVSLAAPVFTAQDLSRVKASEYNGQYFIELTLEAVAALDFERTTAENTGTTLALIFDDAILMAPKVQSAIPGGQLAISGGFSKSEALSMARLLQSGTLSHDLYLASLQEIAASGTADCSALFSN